MTPTLRLIRKDPEPIKRRLRTLFKQRDAAAVRLAKLDEQVRSAVRDLADAEGVSFIRIEAARKAVEDEELAA